MNALTMTMRDVENLARRTEPAGAVRCLHCGKPLGMLRRIRDSRFCGDLHRRAWHLQRLVRVLAY